MRENPGKTVTEAVRESEGIQEYRPNQVTWMRIFRIMKEFIRGFRILKKYELAVTFFGSARSAPEAKACREARELAKRLSMDGFTVITGGGGGIMRAANQGAHDAGGESVGLNIKLPHEQHLNGYTTDSEEFHYFFTRKVMLSFASEAYVFFPGGFGTMDEFFEIVTLIQTKKIQKIPVVVVGKEYWAPLLSWIEKTLWGKNKTISKEDMDIYHMADSVDEAYELVRKLVPDGGPY